MAYCPNCVSFRSECNPEPEDYDSECKYFKEYHPENEWPDESSPEPEPAEVEPDWKAEWLVYQKEHEPSTTLCDCGGPAGAFERGESYDVSQHSPNCQYLQAIENVWDAFRDYWWQKTERDVWDERNWRRKEGGGDTASEKR